MLRIVVALSRKPIIARESVIQKLFVDLLDVQSFLKFASDTATFYRLSNLLTIENHNTLAQKLAVSHAENVDVVIDVAIKASEKEACRNLISAREAASTMQA